MAFKKQVFDTLIMEPVRMIDKQIIKPLCSRIIIKQSIFVRQTQELTSTRQIMKKSLNKILVCYYIHFHINLYAYTIMEKLEYSLNLFVLPFNSIFLPSSVFCSIQMYLLCDEA